MDVHSFLRCISGEESMLVLSRKPTEAVMIGGVEGFERLLKVTVLEISHGRVRLGFQVDDDVPIHRWEIWERIRNENPSGTAY